MSGLVDKITKAVMGISAIVVFVITFLQVLCRFVLKSPLPWSTDILRLAFFWYSGALRGVCGKRNT